jgi:thiol-disulfide isomerase/thioredoxin
MKLQNKSTQRANTSAWLIALSLSISSVFASGEGWLTNFENAKKQAASEKKDLLLDFTGSDWCPPCMKLTKEILSQKSFISTSSTKFVLVELDFPQEKKLDAETTKQNEELQQKYKIEGYPTIMLCDATGKPYAQTGFRSGGPEKYSAHIAELQEIRVKRDAAFAKAESAKEDTDKATALVEGLKNLEEDLIDAHYGEVVEQIAKLDPADKSGFVKTRKEAIAKKEAAAKAEAAVESFAQEKLSPLMDAKEYDKAVTATKAFIKENPDLSPDIRDNLLFSISLAEPMEKGNLEGAYTIVDQLVKEYPDTDIAKNIDEVKASIAAQIKQMKGTKKEDAE